MAFSSQSCVEGFTEQSDPVISSFRHETNMYICHHISVRGAAVREHPDRDGCLILILKLAAMAGRPYKVAHTRKSQRTTMAIRTETEMLAGGRGSKQLFLWNQCRTNTWKPSVHLHAVCLITIHFRRNRCDVWTLWEAVSASTTWVDFSNSSNTLVSPPQHTAHGFCVCVDSTVHVSTWIMKASPQQWRHHHWGWKRHG